MSFFSRPQTPEDFPKNFLATESPQKTMAYQEVTQTPFQYDQGGNNENLQPGAEHPSNLHGGPNSGAIWAPNQYNSQDYYDMDAGNVLSGNAQSSSSNAVDFGEYGEYDQQPYYDYYDGTTNMHQIAQNQPADFDTYQQDNQMNSTSIIAHAGLYPEQGTYVGPIRKKHITKVNKNANLPAFVPRKRSDNSSQPSDEEIQKTRDLQLTEGDKILTDNLSKRILLELLVRRISQKEFSEGVLGRSQGTFSDLVNTPKSWDRIKTRGRQTYMKMLEWIDSSEADKRAALKKDTYKAAEQSTQPSEPVTKPKRTRTVFTHAQLAALQTHFEKFPNSYAPELEELAHGLGLHPKVVSTYFVNSRRKLQKEAQLNH